MNARHQEKLFYPRIIVTGDSIASGGFRSGGFGLDLASQYTTVLDVLNRGFPGYNSAQLLRAMEDNDAFADLGAEVQLFVILIGTNDSCEIGVQGAPVTEFEHNLRSIFKRISQHHPRARMIAVTPAPPDNLAWGSFQNELGSPEDVSHSRSPRRTKEYADCTIRVCAEHDIPSIDMYAAVEQAFVEGKTFDDIYYDGLHFSPSGNQIIADRLTLTIRTRYPDLHPLKLSSPFPFFGVYGHGDNPKAQEFMQMLDSFPDAANIRARALALEARNLETRGFPKTLIPH